MQQLTLHLMRWVVFCLGFDSGASFGHITMYFLLCFNALGWWCAKGNNYDKMTIQVEVVFTFREVFHIACILRDLLVKVVFFGKISNQFQCTTHIVLVASLRLQKHTLGSKFMLI